MSRPIPCPTACPSFGHPGHQSWPSQQVEQVQSLFSTVSFSAPPCSKHTKQLQTLERYKCSRNATQLSGPNEIPRLNLRQTLAIDNPRVLTHAILPGMKPMDSAKVLPHLLSSSKPVQQHQSVQVATCTHLKNPVVNPHRRYGRFGMKHCCGMQHCFRIEHTLLLLVFKPSRKTRLLSPTAKTCKT